MAEIQLNHQESLRILQNEEAPATARVVAAAAVLFFEINHADDTGPEVRQIVYKLLRMSGTALDEAAEDDLNG